MIKSNSPDNEQKIMLEQSEKNIEVYNNSNMFNGKQLQWGKDISTSLWDHNVQECMRWW